MSLFGPRRTVPMVTISIPSIRGNSMQFKIQLSDLARDKVLLGIFTRKISIIIPTKSVKKLAVIFDKKNELEE